MKIEIHLYKSLFCFHNGVVLSRKRELKILHGVTILGLTIYFLSEPNK